MKRHWFKNSIYIGGIACLLSACSLTQPIAPNIPNAYLLNATSTTRFCTQPRPQSLQVLQPTASAGFQRRDMLYQTAPHRLQAFSRNTWAAPPAQMLLPLLVESLQNSGCFQAVTAAPSASNADLRLEVSAVELVQIFRAKQSVINLTLQANLVDNRNNAVAASQRLSVEIPAGIDPETGVNAANEATRRVLQSVVQLSVQRQPVALQTLPAPKRY